MSSKIKSVFVLEGQFLSFVGSELKYLNLLTTEGEHCIKLSKELRRSRMPLQHGDRLQILGEKSVDWQTGRAKLKAHRLLVGATMPIADRIVEPLQHSQPESSPKPEKSTKILFCQKPGCMKRGGTAICQALSTALEERNLTDRVALCGTGCMKNCKAGPNLVIAGKAQYDRLTVADIPNLMNKHFPAGCQSTPLSPAAIG